MSGEPPPGPRLSEDGKFYWDGQRWAPLPAADRFSGKAIVAAIAIAIGSYIAWVVGVIVVFAMNSVANTPRDSNGIIIPGAQPETDAAALGMWTLVGVLPAVALALWYWWNHRRARG